LVPRLVGGGLGKPERSAGAPVGGWVWLGAWSGLPLPSGCHCRTPGRCRTAHTVLFEVDRLTTDCSRGWARLVLRAPTGMGDLPRFPCLRPATCDRGTSLPVLTGVVGSGPDASWLSGRGSAGGSRALHRR